MLVGVLDLKAVFVKVSGEYHSQQMNYKGFLDFIIISQAKTIDKMHHSPRTPKYVWNTYKIHTKYVFSTYWENHPY